MNPVDPARQHAEQAREKLDGIEREAGEIVGAYPDGLPPEAAASLAARWQTTIGAAQAHATLATAETLGVVVGLLEVLAMPQRYLINTDTTLDDAEMAELRKAWGRVEPLRVVSSPDIIGHADAQVEWQWWQGDGYMGGEWVNAYSEADANLCADNQGDGRTRFRVVGPWSERPAR